MQLCIGQCNSFPFSQSSLKYRCILHSELITDGPDDKYWECLYNFWNNDMYFFFRKHGAASFYLVIPDAMMEDVAATVSREQRVLIKIEYLHSKSAMKAGFHLLVFLFLDLFWLFLGEFRLNHRSQGQTYWRHITKIRNLHNKTFHYLPDNLRSQDRKILENAKSDISSNLLVLP